MFCTQFDVTYHREVTVAAPDVASEAQAENGEHLYSSLLLFI